MDGNMQASRNAPDTRARYARCIETSKRIRWEIDRDVIRGRSFDFSRHFLPDGLSQVDWLEFLDANERKLMSHIQGRSYAYIFGLVERFINAKVLELSAHHALGDQVALEALVGFSQEELKHQELFRRIESMIGAHMPAGWQATADADAVAQAVLSKSTWAVLALTCHIELFTQAHYKQSIGDNDKLDPLYRDVFLFHWREESQHAILDELEWRRVHETMDEAARDRAVDDLIDLVLAVDGILQAQARADTDYFLAICGRQFDAGQAHELHVATLAAYRWQYILSGAQEPRFLEVLGELTTAEQLTRIVNALATLDR